MLSVPRYALKLVVDRMSADDLCPIEWSRFLDRPVFTLGSSDWSNCIRGKNVLITGAAGSIGSALAMRLMEALPKTLILLDHSKHNLHRLYEAYKQRNVIFPRVEFVQVDILCQSRLEKIFSQYRPEIVFHTAAMKHLVGLESDPFLALENNLLGTIRLLQMIDGSEVECLVNVSTDKAVNPTNVLGVTKRITELLLLGIESHTCKISVRLGNVLGSSGSVGRLFLQSLRNRLPLTITDVQASRYFVTLEEAADFLIASSSLSGSALLLPEMGKPRSIIELASFLEHQLKFTKSNDVNFIGLYDGEKRFEQLTYDHEFLKRTSVDGLDQVCGNTIDDGEEFSNLLGRLLELIFSRSRGDIIGLLMGLVPEFSPSRTLLRCLD